MKALLLTLILCGDFTPEMQSQFDADIAAECEYIKCLPENKGR